MPFLLTEQKKRPDDGPPGTPAPLLTPHEDLALQSGQPLASPAKQESLPFHLELLCRGTLDAARIERLSSAHAQSRMSNDLASHWIRTGRLSERLYYLAASQKLGIPYLDEQEMATLEDVSPDCPLDALDLINCRFMQQREASTSPFRLSGGHLVCAPQGKALDLLAAKLTANPDLKHRIRLTRPSLFLRSQRERSSKVALRTDVYRLRQDMPAYSSHSRPGGKQMLFFIIGILVVLGGSLWASELAILFNMISLVVFLSISSLRLVAWLNHRTIAASMHNTLATLVQSSKKQIYWPSYSLLVPLYREAAVVPDLIASLRRINYPEDRLTIMLLIEADDQDTHDALVAENLPPLFSIMTIPVNGPRTKPKALNYALAFVSSELVAVFDAEDRPHPMQLREAALRMQAGGPSLGCLQGRLAIDNRTSSFLTRQFAMEYAALFDGLLPFLANEQLPVPLGGTSNHFRTSVLREIGAWDPYNVTEDADLGMRLTRFGYRIEMLQTDTWEEAPVRYRSWLKQRTRWFKGWMQTWLVHMREPHMLWMQMGALNFLAFQILIGGMLVSALIHPLYFITFGAALASAVMTSGSDSIFYWFLLSLNSFNLIFGYGSMMLLARSAVSKRYGAGWMSVFAMPLYWLAMTPAAWRALFQLLVAPHHWEKTEHGIGTRPPVRSN
ncbi:Glycosyltransferase, catalytic subunit of cellulose synthase and poly-beta-1,6-N-acetylglucosamine synthase [Cohaesibacter sp. ES.047]|uniref:glycosyltransferase family 2 protein n=1 Tax=Cohaesibacter sp. ES.047 TaxID=1798205 RepID=UPI000BB81967|nr:glycosyltransferase [Cohaesibacter sp. ES.047]SNY91891.1 Glycosyltransferase, catalytic subunit of cellulose synthase and poly-beta-1,6-N-acetylglucosamine synthase [Cohaesibacter sp. ES.047]